MYFRAFLLLTLACGALGELVSLHRILPSRDKIDRKHSSYKGGLNKNCANTLRLLVGTIEKGIVGEQRINVLLCSVPFTL